MQKITPFLWFNDQAEDAANFYVSTFKNGKIGEVMRYGEDMPGQPGKVMTVNFELAGLEFTALNGGPEFSFTPAISWFVCCQTEAEVDTLYEKLSAGGGVLMELMEYPFSKKFAWVMDRFGVSWQISLTGDPQKIIPYFLFVGEQHGKAEEAIHLYTSLFKNSSIRQMERFGLGEDEPEGMVKHARFLLDGQEFMAMESGLDHQFTFTEATSFMIHCKDQAEVDHFWNRFTQEGEESQCGWLRDKFGVSWQVVPDILFELMNDPDPEKAGRVTQAMLKMQKIDISALQQAHGEMV